jgi:hypothetical protein
LFAPGILYHVITKKARGNRQALRQFNVQKFNVSKGICRILRDGNQPFIGRPLLAFV